MTVDQFDAQPLILDLFCGAGGAGEGYKRAGFGVLGVDIKDQPRYPGPFIHDDVMDFLQEDLLAYGICAVHASPPCQRYSVATKRWGRSDDHPDLVGPVRERLAELGIPFIIENVPGSPLIPEKTITLCGSQFGLGANDRHGEWRELRRHRLFEIHGFECTPVPCNHQHPVMGVYGSGGGREQTRGYKAVKSERIECMGIDWMTMRELSQAIPPAYTEMIGRSLMHALTKEPTRA